MVLILEPFRASLDTTFLKSRGRGEGLRTVTCLKAVVGSK